MSKSNNTKTPAAPKAKKPKTPAQLARKARNEQDAAARLILLQREQAEFAVIREQHGALSDDACRALIAEKAAREQLDSLLACDMQVGGEPFSKRLMRFLGRDRLKGIATGHVAVRDVISACWTYAKTQHETLLPVDGE